MSPANMNKAYFERRLSANVHKEHAVPSQHVLKHFLAWKSSDSRSGRGIKPTGVTSGSFDSLVSS